MASIAAVIFDMDGTVLDSREIIYHIFGNNLANYGVSRSRDEIASALLTGPMHDIYKKLAPHIDADELRQTHDELAEHSRHLIKAYDHAPELLDWIKDQGIKCAIFTGYDKNTYVRLTDTKLIHYFDSIVENTRYTKHKPDAEGIFIALADMDIDSPRKVIYVGDAAMDIAAGKNAGVYKTVGVTHGFGTQEDLVGAEADHVVHSLIELKSLLADIIKS